MLNRINNVAQIILDVALVFFSEVKTMAKKSKTSFKKDKKQTKDTNRREEYSKEFNQVIHNNPPLEVTKERGK